MQPSTINTINTVAQVFLIVLGFVAFLIEFLSDHFQKGKARHNTLRVIKLVAALLVATLGGVTYKCGNVLSDRTEAQLSNKTAGLATQVGISELAVSAKAGSRKAFTSLMKMTDSSPTNDFLKATLRELELFYDNDRNLGEHLVLVQAGTLTDPGFSTDELVRSMVSGPDATEEAAINSLGHLNTKAAAAVRELCREAKESKNLRAAARATWALQEITGEKFRPLAFDAVGKWWEQHQTNPAYNGNYNGYFDVFKRLYDPPPVPFLPQEAEQYIKQLDDTIATDPDALHARCLKAGCLLMLGRQNEARPLLDEVRSRRADYYWLYMWDAAAHLRTNDTQGAIELLNKAFDKSPTAVVEQNVMQWKIFAPIRANERINWPSKKIKDVQP